jgi:integrase
MRRGELLGLRWREVDLEKGLLTVIQQLARQRTARLGFGAPKTARGRRTINLSPETVNALQAVRDAQAFARRALGDAYEAKGDLLFCRDNGTRHDPDVVSKRFVRHVKKSGVRHLHFHGLRHTSAVIGLRELGEWPDECTRRLGHSSVAFTLETYGHLLPERGQNIAAAFDRLIAERRSKHAREHFVSI